MRYVAAADEVGRGALAGPLVAAAVLVAQPARRPRWLPANRDSKMLTPAARRRIAELAQQHFAWAIGVVAPAEIDAIGLQPANHLAIRRAIFALPQRPQSLLLDYVAGFRHELPCELVVHGDRLRWPIALASVIAKVHRDHYMAASHELFPMYGFSRHVGYGTQVHRRALREFGPSPLHRRSFTLHV